MTCTIWSVFLNGRNLAFIWTHRGRVAASFVDHHLVQQRVHRRRQCHVQRRHREDQQGPCAGMTRTIRGYWNDTEKNNMDKRKDDMHESRNVVKFFF